MIHTFSIIIETFDDPVSAADAEELRQEIIGNLCYEASALGILAVTVAPITGVQRQHLIGETEDHV